LDVLVDGSTCSEACVFISSGVKETRGAEPVQTTCSPTCYLQRKQAERLGRSQTQQALSSSQLVTTRSQSH